jgi:serine/threonine protein kinase
MVAPPPESTDRNATRYVLLGELASGGMGTVHYGRRQGAMGFWRPVAIKRMHAQFAHEPEFVSMFIDEARICARVSHANVVPVLDVVDAEGELSIIMEYVHGVALDHVLAAHRSVGLAVPVDIVIALAVGVLHGLQAAHEARGADGEPLGIVHRDVSPQNVLVGADGLVRLLDFGIAKAQGRLRQTPAGQLKGKLLYMAPEQLRAAPIDTRADLYGTAAVIWEMLCGYPVFERETEQATIHAVLFDEVPPPRALRADVPEALSELVMRGLARDANQRFEDASDFASELEHVCEPASQFQVRRWLDALLGDELRRRAARVAAMEAASLAPTDESQALDGTTRVVKSAGPTPTEPPAMAPAILNAGTPVTAAPRHTEQPRVRGRRRGTAVGVVLAAVVTGGLGLALVRGRARHEATSSPAPVVPVATPTREVPSAKVASETPPASAAPMPVQPIAAPPLPSPAVPPRLPEEHPPRKRAPRRAAVAAPSEAERKPSGEPDCTQPYTVDAIGIKRWRRECLK